MAERGSLETMARRDLDALLDEIGSDYRPGALEALSGADPEWRAELERVEREVGALYLTLCEADQAIADWRRAVAELVRLWRRVHEDRPVTDGLSDVA
jgi:hypothetical protein